MVTSFKVMPASKKEQQINILQDEKIKDFIILPERFWAKTVSFNKFIDFIKKYKCPYDDTSLKLELETQYQDSKKKPRLSPQEANSEVLSLLKDKELLQRINKEFDKKIVGEKNSRLAIFINACGKLVINAAIASYNLCLSSNSGAGKDYVCKNVLAIFPSEEVVIRSRISPTAFTYWHNAKFEPEWTWDNKIALLWLVCKLSL